MQRIVVRDWTDGDERPFSLAEPHDELVWSIDAAPIVIQGPRVEIVSAQLHDADGSYRVAWQSEWAQGSVVAQRLDPHLFRFQLELNVTHGFRSSGLAWSFQLRAQTARVLNGRYRLVTPRSLQQNRFTPLALQARSGLHWIGVTSPDVPAGHEWRAEGPSLHGTLWLDHPLAHPRFTFEGPNFRNWHNEYVWPSAAVLRTQLDVMVTQRPVPLLVLGRYPERHRAVMAITDHADHDSYERLAALWYGQSRPAAKSPGRQERSGFVHLRLPFTKSVFTATPQPDGPGLHCRPFADLCRAGHEAGIEICPHGVHSTVQPAVSELEALLAPFRAFEPRTWIDHGNRFLSNYGRRGWDRDDEYSLLPWLDGLGIKYVWGRLDFGQSLPRGQLNQVAIDRFCGWSYMQDLPRHVLRSVAAGRPWAVAHGLSALAFQLIPEGAMREYFLAQRSIQRAMRADVRALPVAVWQAGKLAATLALPPGVNLLARHVLSVRDELSRAPIFFPEHDAVARNANDRWLFNTVAVHDVASAYSPASIETLLDDYGIHLSHTYLTSISRAHVSHAIEADGAGHWRLTRSFARNLQHLAEQRDAGRLWVASMGELGDFWQQRLQVRLRPDGPTRWTMSLSQPPNSGEACSIQVVVIGAASECRADDVPLRLEPLHDDLRIAPLRLRHGQTIHLECPEN